MVAMTAQKSFICAPLNRSVRRGDVIDVNETIANQYERQGMALRNEQKARKPKAATNKAAASGPLSTKAGGRTGAAGTRSSSPAGRRQKASARG